MRELAEGREGRGRGKFRSRGGGFETTPEVKDKVEEVLGGRVEAGISVIVDGAGDMVKLGTLRTTASPPSPPPTAELFARLRPVRSTEDDTEATDLRLSTIEFRAELFGGSGGREKEAREEGRGGVSAIAAIAAADNDRVVLVGRSGEDERGETSRGDVAFERERGGEKSVRASVKCEVVVSRELFDSDCGRGV